MGELVAFDRLRGYLADGHGPGLVVLHEWWGLVPHIEDVTERFAALGFTALAPDLYDGATAGNEEPDEAEKLMMRLNPDRAVTRVATTVEELRRRGCAKVGVVGFCMGGALAIAASAPAAGCDVDATVAYYGIWPRRGERTISAPVLIHVAEHEEHNPPALPANFPTWFEGMGNVEIHIYPGTQHAFFNDTYPESYDASAAELSWERTVAFLLMQLA
jgi:carboxymethylenebutenolidase